MNPTQAFEPEKQIKGWSRAKKKKLMENNFDLIQRLAAVRKSKK